MVEFTDGSTDRYQANVIEKKKKKNMFAQVDEEGRQYLLLEEITDHKKDNTAIPISEGKTRSANGRMVPKVTTKRTFLTG
jgi:hypothetical protein